MSEKDRIVVNGIQATETNYNHPEDWVITFYRLEVGEIPTFMGRWYATGPDPYLSPSRESYYRIKTNGDIGPFYKAMEIYTNSKLSIPPITYLKKVFGK